jgi:hypothetical protein
LAKDRAWIPTVVLFSTLHNSHFSCHFSQSSVCTQISFYQLSAGDKAQERNPEAVLKEREQVRAEGVGRRAAKREEKRKEQRKSGQEIRLLAPEERSCAEAIALLQK